MLLHSEELDKLFSALATYHKEAPSPEKDKTVTVKTKSGGSYKFTYASLGSVMSATKPVLAKHGLSIVQFVTGKGVQTMLAHESGQYLLSDSLELCLSDKDMQDAQKVGSQTTYFKRYQWNAITGADAEFDDDGASKANQQTVDDKQWLNKTDKQGNFTKEWSQVLGALESGKRTLNDVYDAFRVNKENRAELEEIYG